MKLLEKAGFVTGVFVGGVKVQLEQSWTWGSAASIGLYQGLKYTGSVKNGIIGGLATLGVITGANGIYNIAKNWDGIKKVCKED